ncbi:MAG: response regulator [Proteobacteria bacterium]|nr:response regulator [Pseudomonadota bacterium]MBU1648046.1 response regulator [Pseudomonadota bacterium]
MFFSATKRSLRRSQWLLLGLTGVFVLIWKIPLLPVMQGTTIMTLPMHIFSETFSIIVSMMIFALIYASTEKRPVPILLLGCAFLAVGLLDFAHTLSYKGMPDFITPANPEKGLNFWLAARLIFALAMLAFVLLPWRPFSSPRSRYWLLSGSLILTALIYWLGLYHQDIWPTTYIEGQGLTRFKIGAEYTIMAILLGSAILFYQQARISDTPYDAASLFVAVSITILSELTFTLYTDVFDIFNVLGHLYKILAYIFICKAIFFVIVQEPYQKLHRAMSALKENESALRQSKEHFRIIMDSLDALVYVADRENHELLFVNAYGKKNWGDVVGKRCWQLLQANQTGPCPFCTNDRLVDPEGNPTGVYVWEFQNTMTKCWYECRDQAIRWPDGRIVRMEIATDITLRKQAIEEVFKAKAEWEKTFDSIGELITIQDLQMHIVRVNQATLQTLNISKEEAIGKFCYELFRGVSTPCEGCPVTEALQDLKSSSVEIYHETQGKTFLVSVAPILDEKGHAQRLVHIAKDVTDLRRAEVQLQQAQKMESIGTLAGGIAHDFNNILGAILGFTELAMMRKKEDQEGLREDLQQVLMAADRATMLVRQILTFSRKKPEERQALQISLVINEAMKMLRASIPTTIEIRQEITSPAVVLADPSQIHQLIMNLATNAYQAMEEQGGVLGVTLKEITVDADAELVPGPYVMLSVSDTGGGMEKAVMDRMFEPYFTTKEVGKGTGLGLAVVHGIVKSHKGRIAVYSEPGRGTTFNVYLPMVVSEATAATEVVDIAPLMAKAHERIMVVDDEDAIRDMVSRFLTKAGYRVEAFGNGLQAWHAFSHRPDDWDLILSDQTMPGMTGDQLLAKVLALRPGLPIIVCSGYSQILNGDEAKKVGGSAFLQKPINRNALLTQVAKSLEKQAEQEGP